MNELVNVKSINVKEAGFDYIASLCADFIFLYLKLIQN